MYPTQNISPTRAVSFPFILLEIQGCDVIAKLFQFKEVIKKMAEWNLRSIR